MVISCLYFTLYLAWVQSGEGGHNRWLVSPCLSVGKKEILIELDKRVVLWSLSHITNELEIDIWTKVL